ncbi:putative PolB exonuclease-like 3'-5' exonuclease [Methylohalomonas lacus]|uniref:PolB exonuclease-like 3'-5' exonuclease n=1 Tax=Methylohalomonas lacus TaxID=398773 RepID=A0AAE3HKA3_9GAMM|nr:3'-5' exonuclease [Methylohalomonas lacus]MCS3903915.1 putative PolB exonuclease-like 3'-5' exonuclease [Methylohalomonas lacus]
MNILVFDIETVPDTESAARLYNLAGLSEAEAAEVMFSRRRQETAGQSDFIRHHLQRVVAISVLLKSGDKMSLWTLGDVDSSEAEIVERFFDGIERYIPTLVSWNGRGFDLPVLHYRALLHGISAPKYWDTGDDDNSFKWNNYLNRFHQRHTDLMDVLAGHEGRASAPLHEIAVMLGFPGKLDISGGDVWERYLDNDIAGIRDYCETDVLNTYLVYLRYELLRGRRDRQWFDDQCRQLRDYLRAETRPHLDEFLQAWPETTAN